MKQPNEPPAKAKSLLHEIDEALEVAPRLSEKQLEDVRRLRRDVVRFVEDGNEERAGRSAALCMRVIRQGEAVKE
jgi:hypothetical protein